MTDTATMPHRRRRKHARPRELLLAAMALFVEKGYADTRADEIAERAGVSKGTLYLYFDGKEQLFADLVAERFFCAVPFEGDTQTDTEGAADALRHVVLAWHRALVDGHMGGVVKLVFTEVHRFPVLADFWVRQVMAPTRQVVRQAVERGVAIGELHPVEPDVVMNALVQPLIATCLHRRVIAPYALCPFIARGHEPAWRHLEWVVRGLSEDHRTKRETNQ